MMNSIEDGKVRLKFLHAIRLSVGNNRTMLRSIAALFGGNLSSAALGIVGGLIVARIMGPGEIGSYQAFTIPLRWLTFLHLGTYDGLWRQIPFYIGKQDPQKVESLAAGAGAWNLLVSAAVSAAFMALAVHSLWTGDMQGAAGWGAQAVCCWGLFYTGYLVATYRTINQFVTLARVQFIQAVANFAMIAGVPFLHFFGLCIRAIVPSVTGVFLYHRNRPIRVRYRLDMKALSEVVKIGFPFSFWGSLYSSAWIAAESALMLSLGGVTALGYFSIAMVMREGINILPLAVNQVLMPKVVETFAKNESVRRANKNTASLTAVLTVLMASVVLIASFSLDVIVSAAIPKYINGIPLMKLCLWFAVIETASLPLNTLFATGRAWLMGRGVVVGFMIFPLAAYLLTPVLGGVLAVAAGSLIGRAARTIIAYLEISILLRREALEDLSIEFH